MNCQRLRWLGRGPSAHTTTSTVLAGTKI